MRGLLDALNSDDGQMGMALLAAAGPQAQPMSFGQRLQGAMGQMQAQKDAKEDRTLKQLMTQLQMQSILEQQAARKEDRDDKLRSRQRTQQFYSALQPQLTTSEEVLASGGGPTPENAARVGQPKPIDLQSLARQFPDQIPTIKALAEAQNFGRSKVAREVTVAGLDGRPQTVLLDDFGGRVGSALPQAVKRETLDSGGAILDRDPYTGAVLGQVTKTQSPDGRASNALGWANYGLGVQRLNQEKPNLQVINDPERGIMFADKSNGLVRPGLGLDGQLVPGENAVKRANSSERVIPVIDQAISMLERGGPTASMLGTGVDAAAGALGFSTKGAQGAAQLKAIEGQIMMAQPRMEGPQSNNDVVLYRQMAAQVGDSTIPAETRLAALRTVRQLHEKYGGIAPAKSSARSLDDLLKQYGAP